MLTTVTFVVSWGKRALVVNKALFFPLINKNTIKNGILISTRSLTIKQP